VGAFTTWGKDAGLRAIKTAAQTSVALLGSDVAGLIHADWAVIGITSALAGAVSILHNLANLDIKGPTDGVQ